MSLIRGSLGFSLTRETDDTPKQKNVRPSTAPGIRTSVSVLPAHTHRFTANNNSIALCSYDLKLSQPLPQVNLARTFASLVLSPPTHERYLAFMSGNFTRLAFFYRIGTILFIASLFMDRTPLQVAFVVSSATGCITIFSALSLFSLDIIKLFLWSHEFWFISLINASHSMLVAYLLGDIRASVSFTSWLAFQSIIMIDANFRTFPSATKSVVSVIPAVIVLLVLFVLDKIRDMNHVVFHIQRLRVDGLDVLIFTSTNIVIFMAKKISRKRAQVHPTFDGLQSIPCVVLKAKLRLTRALKLQGSRSKHIRPEFVTEFRNVSRVQSLVLSSLPLLSVDPSWTLRHQAHLSLGTSTAAPSSRVSLILLYTSGAIGYICALLGSILAQVDARGRSSASNNSSSVQDTSLLLLAQRSSTPLLVAGLLCTCVFCGTFAMHYQSALLRTLFSSFDYVFSLAQCIFLGLGLCDMVYWGPRSIGFITAAVWYLWILTLDALTPLVKTQLCFKRKYIVVVMATFLATNVLNIVGLLLDEFNSFQDRTLMSYQVDTHLQIRVGVQSFVVQRIVTILAWSSRLVWELATQDEDELLFLRGQLEYLSPYDTFPGSTPPLPTPSPISTSAEPSFVHPSSEVTGIGKGEA